jgi:hypothetical protein
VQVVRTSDNSVRKQKGSLDEHKLKGNYRMCRCNVGRHLALVDFEDQTCSGCNSLIKSAVYRCNNEACPKYAVCHRCCQKSYQRIEIFEKTHMSFLYEKHNGIDTTDKD